VISECNGRDLEGHGSAIIEKLPQHLSGQTEAKPMICLTHNAWCSAKIQTGHFMKTSL
jgi:hypothetical protein